MGQHVLIREGTAEEAVQISKMIPEFEFPYSIKEYGKRLDDVNHLILVAEAGENLVGFKVGYERIRTGIFYSWLGGVVPEYRKKGIAQALADLQEDWAKSMNYYAIQVKTWNARREMLHFLLKNDYNIIAVERKEQVLEYRIILEKRLKDKDIGQVYES